MRKTKIICTIGPASMNEETLIGMAKAGMNVARMNFSHGDHEEQGMKMDLVKKVRQDLNLPISIMLDTKGPEYRIGTFKDGSVVVKDGDTFTFTTDDVEGDETKVSVSHKNLHKDLKVGDTLSVCNGIVFFEVTDIKGHDIITKCTNGGTMSNKKSMSFPNKVLSGPYLSEQDKSDILFGIKNDVDFIIKSKYNSKHTSVLSIDDIASLELYLQDFDGDLAISGINKQRRNILTSSLATYIEYQKWVEAGRLEEEFDIAEEAPNGRTNIEDAPKRSLEEVKAEIAIFKKYNSTIPQPLLQELDDIINSSKEKEL